MYNIVNANGALLAGFLVLLLTAPSFSQEKSPAVSPTENPLTFWNQIGQNTMKDWITRSAESMPDSNYNFKPTSDVRSFGQILAHVADSQYVFCSSVLGEKSPNPQIAHVEKTKTGKAEIIAELKAAFAYCDKAFSRMTDSTASQLTLHTGLGMQMPKLFILTSNMAHNAEHYGNLITYLRLKNIVPPSTADELARQPAKK